MKLTLLLAASLFLSNTHAHVQSPAHIPLKESLETGIMHGVLKVGNASKEPQYFRIDVIDHDNKNIRFVTSERVIRLESGQTERIDFYVRKSDVDNIKYVCSKSVFTDYQKATTATMICSAIGDKK